MSEPVLRSIETEARMIAALVAEPMVLIIAGDLELDDFTDPRHRAVHGAIRELQETKTEIDALSVTEAIVMRDIDRDTHVAEQASIYWLGLLIVENDNYNDPRLVMADLRWLRTLAIRRRALCKAA